MTSRLATVVLLVALGLPVAHLGHPRAAPQAGSVRVDDDPAGADASQEPPTFRGRIDLVPVDAFVTDRRGEPVTDLTQADFEVFEEGQPRRIELFRRVDLSGPPAPGELAPRPIRTVVDEELEAARPDVRLFAFFLDDYHVRRSNALVVQQQLARFIRTQLRPDDMLAVMRPLTPIGEVLFTRDHESVIRAIEGFMGRKYDYTPIHAAEANHVRNLSTQGIERVRNALVMDALTALANRMGRLSEGRNAVVFASEGFTTWLPPEMRRPPGYGLAASTPNLPPTPVPVDEQEADLEAKLAEVELNYRMRDVFAAAGRNNAAIYALDPRGATPFEFDIIDGFPGIVLPEADLRELRLSQNTLRTIAEQTHGRAITNVNALQEGLAQMVRESSVYYLLGYATEAPADGQFHRITVRVRRSGVDVRARQGFWAFNETEVVRAMTPAPEVPNPVQQALASIAAPGRGHRHVRTWVGTQPAADGRVRVRLVWEPEPAVAGDPRERAERVEVLATHANGDVVFRGLVPDAAAGDPPRGPQEATFDVQPGTVELRLIVRAGHGGMLDTDTREIAVPDPTAPELQLSTPRVYRARTAREVQALAADAAAVPVVAREFSRSERLLIRFDVSGPGAPASTPTAALLNRTGGKIVDLPVSAAAAGGTHQIDVGLSSVPAGEYLVEITAGGENGRATELVAFRIGA